MIKLFIRILHLNIFYILCQVKKIYRNRKYNQNVVKHPAIH